MNTEATKKTVSVPVGNAQKSLVSWLFWILMLAITGAAAVFSTSSIGKAAFFFCLVFPFLSLLLNRFVKKHLSVSFSLPVSAAKGQPMKGTVSLLNDGGIPCRKTDIHFTIHNDLTGYTYHCLAPLSAPSHGRSSADFTFSSEHCGMLRFTASDARLYDGFSLLSLRAAVSASKTVLILPETFPAEVFIDLPYSEQGDEETRNPLRGMEDPSEIYALREYQSGDPVRQIHWKLSAKRDMPILKEISRPVSRTLLLFWNKTPKTPPNVTDALAEAFSSAAISLAEQGIPFTLGWSDSNGSHFEPILTEDGTFSAISQAVRYGAGTGRDTTAEPSFSAHSKILWFSSSYPFEEEPWLAPDCTVFLCNTKTPATGSRYTRIFRPEETQELFKTIRV